MKYRNLEDHEQEIEKLVLAYLAKTGAIGKDESVQIEVRVFKRTIITEVPAQSSELSPELDRIFALSILDLQLETQHTRIESVLVNNAGILTVGQLCRRFTPEDLCKCRNFGRKALACMHEALGRYNLRIGGHLGQKPGPLEVDKLKSMSLEKLGIHSEISQILSRHRYHIVEQLFPRSDFETFARTSGAFATNPTSYLQDISLALNTEGIPWV